MSLIFVDGCDTYSATSGADFTSKWDFVNDSEFNFNPTGGRYGGGAIHGIDDQLMMSKTFPGTASAPGTDELFISASVFIPATSQSEQLIRLKNAATNDRARLSLRNTGFLVAASAGVSVDSSVAAPYDEWFRLEMRYVCSATVGLFEVRFNEVVVISALNVDTDDGDGGLLNITEASFYGLASGGIFWDDIVIHKSSGVAPTGYLGDLAIETLRPDGAGNSTQWTPSAGANFAAVDDAGLHDGDATYVEESTISEKDLYTVGDMGGTGTVHGVAVTMQARGTGTSPRELDVITRSGGVEESVTKQVPANVAYAHSQSFFPTKPGGGAWTKADVDAMEIGVSLKT